jgi:hypothetical protein
MSDIEEFANELNSQNPVDFESLAEAFDTVFYENPEGTNPVEAKHVSGLTISSPKSVDEIVEKLDVAKEVNPDFVQIGEREYIFDSEDSLSRLIDGIRIGSKASI